MTPPLEIRCLHCTKVLKPRKVKYCNSACSSATRNKRQRAKQYIKDMDKLKDYYAVNVDNSSVAAVIEARKLLIN